MQLEISRLAWADIEAIFAQSRANFGARLADSYAAGLFNLLDMIATNPFMARIRPEYNGPFRLIRYKSHVVFYRVEEQTIKIVRILHGKQDWAEYL
ncbi:MAG: type II toxin-antitoxin system RelE/ParE family toxin [Hyphomicrobiales bacterium]